MYDKEILQSTSQVCLASGIVVHDITVFGRRPRIGKDKMQGRYV